MLIAIGDLSDDELRERTVSPGVADSIRQLVADASRARVRVAGDTRYIAVEDAARYRDALGVPLPTGIPNRC
jgi:ATP-dependent Lhr-like helicase